MEFLTFIAVVIGALIYNSKRKALPNPSSHSTKLTDSHTRFQSIQEVEQAARQGVSIDVNRATVDDWLRLPGISIHQANNLVHLARSGVQFCCVEDIATALDVPIETLQPLTPILGFFYYEAGTEGSPVRVNPNHASQQDLLTVPGIDQRFAQDIIHGRILEGPYYNLVDFQRRLKVPGETIGNLMHYLTFR